MHALCVLQVDNTLVAAAHETNNQELLAAVEGGRAEIAQLEGQLAQSEASDAANAARNAAEANALRISRDASLELSRMCELRRP